MTTLLQKQMLPAKNILKTNKLLTLMPNTVNLPLKSCSRQYHDGCDDDPDYDYDYDNDMHIEFDQAVNFGY